MGLNPQVIIGTNEYNATASQISQQPGFSDTSAAKNNRIYVLTNPSLVEEPSPRVVEGILVLAQMLHPDLFGNVTVNVFNDSAGEFNDTAVQLFSSSP